MTEDLLALDPQQVGTPNPTIRVAVPAEGEVLVETVGGEVPIDPTLDRGLDALNQVAEEPSDTPPKEPDGSEKEYRKHSEDCGFHGYPLGLVRTAVAVLQIILY